MDCPICTVRMCVYLVQSQICFLLVICKLVGILNSHSEFIEIVMINQIPKCLSLLLWKWPRLPFPMGYFIYSAELQSSVFNESQSSGHHVLLRSSFCHSKQLSRLKQGNTPVGLSAMFLCKWNIFPFYVNVTIFQ